MAIDSEEFLELDLDNCVCEFVAAPDIYSSGNPGIFGALPGFFYIPPKRTSSLQENSETDYLLESDW